VTEAWGGKGGGTSGGNTQKAKRGQHDKKRTGKATMGRHGKGGGQRAGCTVELKNKNQKKMVLTSPEPKTGQGRKSVTILKRAYRGGQAVGNRLQQIPKCCQSPKGDAISREPYATRKRKRWEGKSHRKARAEETALG